MDDERLFRPEDLPEFDLDTTDLGVLDLKDYLFEPDPSKIRDISDFDKDTGWIPRINRFGNYIGDGILEPRKKIVKAVFQGFYEDLNEYAGISLLETSTVSLTNSKPTVALRDISTPSHIVCYNRDILYDETEFVISKSRPWIETNLDTTNYNLQEKFILQCFEIIRLIPMLSKDAESMKIASIIISSEIHFSEEDYRVYAVALYNSIVNPRVEDWHRFFEGLNYIEFPIYYSFSKYDILEKQDEIKHVSHIEYILNYHELQQAIFSILDNQEAIIEYGLSSQLNIDSGNKIWNIYISHLDRIANPNYKLFVLIEMILRLYRVFPQKISNLYVAEVYSLIQTSLINIRIFEDLRLLFLHGSIHTRKNFVWASSVLYNIIASCFIITKDYKFAFECLLKSNHYLRTKRDFIQLLFSYSDLLRSIRAFNHHLHLFLGIENYLFRNHKDSNNYEFLDFIDYSLLLNYILPVKLILNVDVNIDLRFILRYLIKTLKRSPNAFPKLPTDVLEKGLILFEDFLDDFEFEDVVLLVKYCPTDILYILYRRELTREFPDLSILILISEFFISVTTNLEYFSYVYYVKYNYTNERLMHFINLFVFYLVIEESEKSEKLIKRFESEFSNKIDKKTYQKIINAVSSEAELERFILSSSILEPYIDRSMVYYINIKKIINEYFKDNNLQTLVEELIQALDLAVSFENYRPRFVLLKLIYRLMLRDREKFSKIKEIRKWLERDIGIYNIDREELGFELISDEQLAQFITRKQMPVFLFAQR